MIRNLLVLALISLAAAATGCRMPAQPFDYSGPTFTGGDRTDYGTTDRAGSILSAPTGQIIYREPTDDMMIPPPTEPMQPTTAHQHISGPRLTR